MDASDRTPATVAHHAYDEGAAQEIESLVAHGSVPFRAVREIWSREKLPEGLSFRISVTD